MKQNCIIFEWNDVVVSYPEQLSLHLANSGCGCKCDYQEQFGLYRSWRLLSNILWRSLLLMDKLGPYQPKLAWPVLFLAPPIDIIRNGENLNINALIHVEKCMQTQLYPSFCCGLLFDAIWVCSLTIIKVWRRRGVCCDIMPETWLEFSASCL